MKILYTPNLICPAVGEGDRARILEAAGPGTTFVEAKDAARQKAEITDTDVIFGRVPSDVFAMQKRVVYYHSIGAGVDAILTPELVQSGVVLAAKRARSAFTSPSTPSRCYWA